MTNAGDIVRRYFDAFYAGDSATARQYLTDDFSFIGPDARFSNPDDFIKASAAGACFLIPRSPTSWSGSTQRAE